MQFVCIFYLFNTFHDIYIIIPTYNILFPIYRDVSLAVRVASTYTHKEGQYFFIKDIINHPQFERSTFDYDYAIVKVYGEIIMGIASQIIPLAASTAADPEVGSWFTIAGWGGAASSENEISFPIEFREIDLPLMDRNTCKNIYSDLTDRQLCLGENSEEASSPCFVSTYSYNIFMI